MDARRMLVGLLFICAAFSAQAQDVEEPAQKTPGDLAVTQAPPKTVPRVLDQATPENTRIVISLGRQRAYLYVGEEVAIDTPVSSGKRRGQTPTGDFEIMDKVAAHQSNLHGDFVDREGQAVRHGVSTRIDAAPSGTVFRIVPAEYYMKLNDEGLALHAGRLPGYPAADTAVRLPADIAPLVFQRVQQGTPVKIED
jgi:lipoprotein-anchoring transpeptidase ErfK/SrfK